MSKTVRPRRSVLYMPGSNTRALEKGRTLPADGLILDPGLPTGLRGGLEPFELP